MLPQLAIPRRFDAPSRRRRRGVASDLAHSHLTQTNEENNHSRKGEKSTLNMMPWTTTLLTPADAAQYLSVGKTTLYELTRSKMLPSFRIGALRRYRLSDLDAFIESLQQRDASA